MKTEALFLEKDTTNYSPGLHILLTLGVGDSELLLNTEDFRLFVHLLVNEQNLEIVGENYFRFPETGGFTAAICLKESHICIHTWPEFNQLTLDVYLCNYLQDNSGKVKVVSQKFTDYFKGEILNQTEVMR